MTDSPIYVKHTTHTDALDTLGSILVDPETAPPRDAIHVAVFLVEAAEAMGPGMDVYLDDDGKARAQFVNDTDDESKYVGIIDPFLRTDIEPGDWFWLLVYPRQITSLEHVWHHPSFPEPGALTKSKAASEKWLRDFAASADIPSFSDLITALEHSDGESVCFGDDASGSIPPEFWTHAEIYIGKEFTTPVSARAEYFSCAC